MRGKGGKLNPVYINLARCRLLQEIDGADQRALSGSAVTDHPENLSLFHMVGGAILIVAVLYALTLPRYAKRGEQALQTADASTETV